MFVSLRASQGLGMECRGIGGKSEMVGSATGRAGSERAGGGLKPDQWYCVRIRVRE